MTKILLAYIHYPVCSGRYVKDALKRLGHDVRSVGNSTLDQIWGGRVHPRHIHYSDGALDTVFPDWTPDLVIVMESAWAYHHPVYSDVPHVVFGVDNHVRDYRQHGIAHYFLAHKATSIMDMSEKDVTWLPCGYDPVAFTPSEIPFDERVYDVAIVGVMYPERQAMIEAMNKAGLSVLAGMGLLYDDYAQAYQNARYALNVSAKGDLNQRVFETAGLGCIVLTHDIADLHDIEYDPGAFTFYKDIDDAIEKVKGGVPFGAGTEWLAQHTWDARAKSIVFWYQKTYQTKKKRGKRVRKTDA
jgi:spore maturation protein CgeB